jgi:hypothetical protein
MKKFLILFAFAGIIGAANAQTTTATPDKEKAAKVEKTSCSKGEAKAGKSCCAGKADTKAEATTETPATTATAGEAKAGCCAGKASTAKSCHGDGPKAEAATHGHEHAAMKEHACTDACKDGAHAYACGERGHACSEACHAHAH